MADDYRVDPEGDKMVPPRFLRYTSKYIIVVILYLYYITIIMSRIVLEMCVYSTICMLYTTIWYK